MYYVLPLLFGCKRKLCVGQKQAKPKLPIFHHANNKSQEGEEGEEEPTICSYKEKSNFVRR